jgi:Cupin-like domain
MRTERTVIFILLALRLWHDGLSVAKVEADGDLTHAHQSTACDNNENPSSASSSEVCAPPSGWDPKEDHPCTIEQITMNDFMERHGSQGGLPPLFPTPLIIVDAPKERNQPFRDLTGSDTILQSFPGNFSVTLSSSNSFSEHRRTIPFAQYLEEVATQRPTPDQKSNETWYLFGETYSKGWKQLLQHYQLPPCQACQRDEHDTWVALSFGIGNSGSGVSWHVHGPGFSEAVHGRKHWVLQQSTPVFHPDQTSYNWMHYNYSSMSPAERPLECTLYPGDMVYFPDMWWHATINLDDYTAFISTFTQEHLFAKNT